MTRIKNKKVKINYFKMLSQILYFGVIIALCFCSYQIYHMPFFNIEIIDYSSDTKDLVIDPISLSHPSGKNIFEFNNAALSSLIYDNPEVENVKIFRKLPNKLQIEVSRRIPFLIIKNYNGFALIDKNGICLQQVSKISDYESPFLNNNFLDKKVENGQKIIDNKLVLSITLLTKLEKKLIDQILEIQIVSFSEISLYLNNSNTVLFGGLSDFEEKQKLLLQILADKQIDKMKIQYIDLSDKNKPIIKYYE
ncbi:MAG: cell division protein FtsQ/DivIB [Clostridia bacterium]